jgi:hypothetical protein
MSVVKVKTWEKAETKKDSSFIKKLGKFLTSPRSGAGTGKRVVMMNGERIRATCCTNCANWEWESECFGKCVVLGKVTGAWHGDRCQDFSEIISGEEMTC